MYQHHTHYLFSLSVVLRMEHHLDICSVVDLSFDRGLVKQGLRHHISVTVYLKTDLQTSDKLKEKPVGLFCLFCWRGASLYLSFWHGLALLFLLE